MLEEELSVPSGVGDVAVAPEGLDLEMVVGVDRAGDGDLGDVLVTDGADGVMGCSSWSELSETSQSEEPVITLDLTEKSSADRNCWRVFPPAIQSILYKSVKWRTTAAFKCVVPETFPFTTHCTV